MKPHEGEHSKHDRHDHLPQIQHEHSPQNQNDPPHDQHHLDHLHDEHLDHLQNQIGHHPLSHHHQHQLGHQPPQLDHHSLSYKQPQLCLTGRQRRFGTKNHAMVRTRKKNYAREKVLNERQRGYAQVKRELWGVVSAIKSHRAFRLRIVA